jgi:hypothetical protein
MARVVFQAIEGETECGTCRHFSQTGEPDYWGDCRRHAPTGRRLAAGGFEAEWPIVSGQDWCGDYSRAIVDSEGQRARIG